jgi:hypothetical protein
MPQVAALNRRGAPAPASHFVVRAVEASCVATDRAQTAPVEAACASVVGAPVEVHRAAAQTIRVEAFACYVAFARTATAVVDHPCRVRHRRPGHVR